MQQPDTSTAAETSKPGRRRRFLRPKPIIWTLVSVLAFCIVVMGVSAFVAKSSVDKLMAEARQLTEDLGDAAATETHVANMRDAARAAHIATSHPVWRATEILPGLGDDMRAVRLLAASGDALIADVAAPLLEFDLSSIGPTDGALDVDAVAELGDIIEQVAPAAQRAHLRLVAEGIDSSTLIGPLQSPVSTVVDGLETAADVLRRLAILSPQLPTMLGSEEPRDYLVLVQNTAEMRTLGGNPGNFLMLTIDDGRMSITNQGNRFNMNTGRAEPIAPLDQWTEALYGDKVGKFFQDITMTPDFAQTAHLARAFWSETLGDPGDAVLAIDPTVLSYLLKATGPVEFSTGETLNAGNVVDQLLSRVYWRFPGGTVEDGQRQDEFFGLAAATIFTEITNADGGLPALLPQLAKGFDEGRILYAATDPTEAKAIDGTLFQGPLYDMSNAKTTTLGVFVNDNTEGKLDYYTDMSVTAASDVCQTEATPTFTTSATYNYNLQPGEVADLPQYVSTGRYFPKGVKSTNLVFYGPVGSTFVSATVDGEEYIPVAGTNDQGRAAVRILIENQPATSHTVEVTFSGAEGEQYGPLDVAHTPMIKEVPVSIDAPGCVEQ